MENQSNLTTRYSPGFYEEGAPALDAGANVLVGIS